MDLRDENDTPFLGREMATVRRFSEATAREVDEAVKAVVSDAGERAREVIAAQRGRIEALISRLEREETLDQEAIRACLEAERTETAGGVSPAAAAGARDG